MADLPPLNLGPETDAHKRATYWMKHFIDQGTPQQSDENEVEVPVDKDVAVKAMEMRLKKALGPDASHQDHKALFEEYMRTGSETLAKLRPFGQGNHNGDSNSRVLMDIELPASANDDIDQFLHSHGGDGGSDGIKWDPLRKHENLYIVTKIGSYDTAYLDVDQKFGQRSDAEYCFATMAALCDPYTVPSSAEDREIMSLQFISDILLVDKQGFDRCLTLAKIVERIAIALNCYDEYTLPRIDRLDLDQALKDLYNWTPERILYQHQLVSNCHDLNLLYSIMAVCFYIIGNYYKNYLHKDNPGLNPFLSFMLKHWRIQTHLIYLGLEFDRQAEFAAENGASGDDEDEDYPEIIRQVIRGAATVRNAISIVLNDDYIAREHDIRHESFQQFSSPWGRKTGNGGLTCDMRLFVSSMLSLGCELLDVTKMLVNLEPDDKYDEDVKYMFDYELDEETIDIYEDEEGHVVHVDRDEYGVHPDCKCKFIEEEEEEEQEQEQQQQEDMYIDEANTEEIDAMAQEAKLQELNPILNRYAQAPAHRSTEDDDDNTIDSEGTDWRDIPRGENVELQPAFEALLGNDMNFYETWPEVQGQLELMGNEVVPLDNCNKLVATVAKAVYREKKVDVDDITPDKVYRQISHDYQFEKMVALNPQAAFNIIDEMMMCPGYRRVLIWFLTHLELSHALIDYVHQLILQRRVVGSRRGTLELSEIERSMLLHEFLANSAVYLSRGTTMMSTTEAADSVASESQVADYKYIATPRESANLIKMVCSMLKSMFERGVLKSGDKEYRNELQTLLLQWVTVSKEAKILFDMC